MWELIFIFGTITVINYQSELWPTHFLVKFHNFPKKEIWILPNAEQKPQTY